jgi:uncharacterized protein
MDKRIVVATDGEDAASGALHTARGLAERCGAEVHVIAVLEPVPLRGTGEPEHAAGNRHLFETAGRLALHQRVEAALVAAGVTDGSWPVSVEVGPVAPTIVGSALERGASLIVLGLGRHALVDRWLGTETALQVMRLAQVPVLAVPADARALPDRAVVAVDFTEFSRDAARGALHLLGPGDTLHLVHVLWRPDEEVPWIGRRDWSEVQRERMRAQMEALATEILGSSGIVVQTHFCEGDAAAETLRLAKTVGAGLVAAGSHGTGFLGRILIGSVSTRLLRGAECMVLVAPPRGVPATQRPQRSVAAASGWRPTGRAGIPT